MKKISLFLAMMLTVTLFGGCSGSGTSSDSKERTLRVCVSDGTSQLYSTVESVAEAYRKEHPEIKIQLETVSTQPEDEAEVKQMKTDVMSGKGPDIFLLSAIGMEAEERNYLFPNVKKAIESGVFSKLDDYMEKDDFWKTADIQDEILKAGSYNGRQYVLPITINFPMLVQEKEGELDISGAKTFMDCLEKAAESKNKSVLDDLNGFYMRAETRLLLENAVDYEEQKVLFEKEVYMSLAAGMKDYQPEEDGGILRSGTATMVNGSFGEENLTYQILPTAMDSVSHMWKAMERSAQMQTKKRRRMSFCGFYWKQSVREVIKMTTVGITVLMAGWNFR